MAFKHVHAITPNPALDLSGDINEITPNEKNYVLSESRFPGGNAVNCGRLLSRLGCAVTIGGFMGGSTGEQVKNLLGADNIRTDFIRIAGETRINVTVSNRATHQQTRFSFPGPVILRPESTQLIKKYAAKKRGSLFIFGGSFPPKFTIKEAKAIIRGAHLNKIATIVDVPAEHLRSLIHAKPLMIKPNLFEFEQLVGKNLKTIAQIVSEAQKFLKHCPLICISSVQKGVLLVTKTSSYFSEGPPVQAKSSVGAGDSLVGGMAAGMLNEGLSYETFFGRDVHDAKRAVGAVPLESWQAILNLGVGSAMATVTHPGTELGSREEILKYAKKVRVTKI